MSLINPLTGRYIESREEYDRLIAFGYIQDGSELMLSYEREALYTFIDRNLSTLPMRDIQYLQNPVNQGRIKYAKQLENYMIDYAREYRIPYQRVFHPDEVSKPVGRTRWSPTPNRRFTVPGVLADVKSRITSKQKTLGEELYNLHETERRIEEQDRQAEAAGFAVRERRDRTIEMLTKPECEFGVDCRDMSDAHRDSVKHKCKLGRECKFALRGNREHMMRYTHDF